MSIQRDFPDLPPVWAAGAAALAVVFGRTLPLVPLPGFAVEVGFAAMACGVALAGWAAVWFMRKRTPIEPRETPRSLIVEGPFRINRNPIYTGMVLVVLGLGLWSGGASGVIPALALPLVLTVRFIEGEEEALRQAFGREGEAYLRSSRRW